MLTIYHFFFFVQSNGSNEVPTFEYKESVITFSDKLQIREEKFCFRSIHCQSARLRFKRKEGRFPLQYWRAGVIWFHYYHHFNAMN